jgi:hypothetical protein
MLTYEQGNEIYDMGDYQRAFNIFFPLAESGDVRAQISVASMYLSGMGIPQSLTEAMKWYRPAANQGHPLAQYSLAIILFDIDPEESIHLLFRAANQNVTLAQSLLGDIYSGSYNLPGNIQESLRDISEAIKWYTKAGEGGFSYAYHRLGEIFSDGKETEKDERQSIKYYQEAAQEGYEPSQEVLGRAYAEGLLTLPKDPEQSRYWFTQAREGNGMPLNRP